MKSFKDLMEIVAPDVKNDLKSLDASSFSKKHGKSKSEIKNTFESSEEKVPEPGREAVGGRFTSRPPKSVMKPAPQVTSEQVEELEEMDKSQDPPGRDGGIQFPPGPKVSKKDIKAVKKDPVKHLSDLLAKEYEKKKMKEEVGQIDENSPTHIVYFRHPTLAKMRGIEVNANDENDAHKKAYKKLKELEPFHHKNMKDYDVEKLSEEVEQIEEGRPSQRHPLEGHEYHKKTDAELVHIAKDAHKAAEAMKGHNTDAENKYRDRKSTRLNSSHMSESRMPSSA